MRDPPRHTLSGGSPTPYVGYHYDDTSSSGRYTKGLRPTARPYDPHTALQNNLNRWYDPLIGRWVSEDPLPFDRDAQGILDELEASRANSALAWSEGAESPSTRGNQLPAREAASSYHYVRNNPVSGIDPYGLKTVSISIHICADCLAPNPQVAAAGNRCFFECFKNLKRDTVKIWWWHVKPKALCDGLETGKKVFNSGDVWRTHKVIENTELWALGRNSAGSYEAEINTNSISSSGGNMYQVYGEAVFHEVCVHSIGDRDSHYTWSGHPDSKTPTWGAPVSKAACEGTRKKLGVR